MKRQLMVMVLATTSLVLIALLVPMGVLVQRFVQEDALSSIGFEVQQVETMLATVPDRDAVANELAALNAERDGVRASVVFNDGTGRGPDTAVTPQVVEVQRSGRTIVVDTDAGAEFLSTAYGRTNTTLIRLVVDEDRFNRGVTQSWLVLAALGLTLLGLTLGVADRLGRFFVRPLVALADTAAHLGAGDLQARVEPSGPPDLQQLGTTFNLLAARIGELVTLQREDAADLAHRLRTPLTAMRLDAENLPEASSRARMSEHVDTLATMISAIIDEARRPVREGAGAHSDASAVVAERATFWSVLAEDQDRRVGVRVPQEPVHVRASVEDLTAAVDALLGNVFDHTPEGTAVTVDLRARDGGGAELSITDAGPGMPDTAVVHRGTSRAGSTGLGLDIARRTAEASGGTLSIESPPGGGTRCRLTLGGPTL